MTPLGLDVPTTWQALLEGRSGAGPITLFDASNLDVRFGCEVKDFDPRAFMDHREVRRTDRFTQFALGAPREALLDSGISTDNVDTTRVGVAHRHRHRRRAVAWPIPSARSISAALTCQPAGRAHAHGQRRFGAHRHHLRLPRPQLLHRTSACATGNNALGEAMEIIKRGDADVMVAGGSDAALVPFALATLSNAGALSKRNDDPTGSLAPLRRHPRRLCLWRRRRPC